MNTLEAIANRKSVRTYTNDIVESDKLEKILNVGNEAARAGEIYFTIVTNKEVLNMVAETGKNVMLNSGNDFLVNTASIPGYNPIYNAPIMVVISGKTTTDVQGMAMNAANAACAGQNMLIAATSLGLGSCYTVSPTLAFMVPEVKAAAQISEDLTPSCVILIGYSEDTRKHAEREDIQNINYCK